MLKLNLAQAPFGLNARHPLPCQEYTPAVKLSALIYESKPTMQNKSVFVRSEHTPGPKVTASRLLFEL